MLDSHRYNTRSHRMLVTVTLVVASAGVGFAIGRHPDVGRGVQAASLMSTTAHGNSGAPTHDGSLPDTADTLGHEKLHDEEGAPTF